MAGFREAYHPMLRPLSARAISAAPTSQLERRPAREQRHHTPTTSAWRRPCRGAAAVTPSTGPTTGRDDEHLRDLQSQLQHQPEAAYAQPLLRGFRIDNTRQQLAGHADQPRHLGGVSCAATITSTLANVRNAYWDLVFARRPSTWPSASLELADKLVEDNQARVEVGTLAPLDIVQAEAEAATRRQTLAAGRGDGPTAELALKRLHRQRHRRPALAPRSSSRRSARRSSREPIDIEARRPPGPPERTDLEQAQQAWTATTSRCATCGTSRCPALDLTASYGAAGARRHAVHPQGQRPRQHGHRHHPGRLSATR